MVMKHFVHYYSLRYMGSIDLQLSEIDCATTWTIEKRYVVCKNTHALLVPKLQ